jgi:hypothetical protein
MLRIAAVLAAMTGSAAAAQVATVSDCRFEARDTTEAVVYCQIENLSEIAIARIRFELAVIEDGRSVPWVTQGGGMSQRSIPLPGGIEPTEKRETFISIVQIPSEADLGITRVDVTGLSFEDLNGDPINAPAYTYSQPRN